MSDWITDRRPTAEDAHDFFNYVWVTTDHGHVLRQLWDHIGDRPWMPIARPEPYVKPSRFEIYGAVGGWQVWGVKDNNGFDIIGFISRDHAKWAVEQLEKVIP